MVIKFKDIDVTLGTRRLGKNIRDLISQKIQTEALIVFDFDGVELISNSFADECFGKLIEQFGLEFVKSKTTFKNTNHLVDMVIKKAIVDRMNKNILCQI